MTLWFSLIGWLLPGAVWPPDVLLHRQHAGNTGNGSVRSQRTMGQGGNGEAESASHGLRPQPAAAGHALVDPVRGGGAVCLVAGPGYGKTAFIVDLLSTVGGRTVYFSLDEGDRDPKRFLSYLAVALGMEPNKAVVPPALDWSASGELDGAVLDLAARLVDFIREKAGDQTLVAIDDFHLVEVRRLW